MGFRGLQSFFLLSSLWDLNITCMMECWSRLGFKILFVNLMEVVDPLFRKICVCLHVYTHTSFFIQFLGELIDIWKPLSVLSRSWFAYLCLHTSRHRDLTTLNSRPFIAEQLWMLVFLSLSSWDFPLCRLFPLVLVVIFKQPLYPWPLPVLGWCPCLWGS